MHLLLMINYLLQIRRILSLGPLAASAADNKPSAKLTLRPLTEKYLELENQATGELPTPGTSWGRADVSVFCLLLNKVEFARDSQQLSISTLSLTRSTLCEILAIRVLRECSPTYTSDASNVRPAKN